jgi:hypothetical protein
VPAWKRTHGRQNVITDARTGSVTNYFNNADQVSGTRLPSADGIQSPQISSNLFDNMGRIVTNILADSTTVTSEYYLTGQPKRTYGSRTYPVGYGYDAQGRMTKMTNWSNFATTNGARVTTWNYNENRGWTASITTAPTPARFIRTPPPAVSRTAFGLAARTPRIRTTMPATSPPWCTTTALPLASPTATTAEAASSASSTAQVPAPLPTTMPAIS